MSGSTPAASASNPGSWARVGERAVLAMAGLWSVWKDPATGLWVTSAAVITTDANDDVSSLHDRMPVLLPRDAWATWLDPDERDQDLLRSLLTPAPDGILDIHPVSMRVNDVRNDGPDLMESVDLCRACRPKVRPTPARAAQGRPSQVRSRRPSSTEARHTQGPPAHRQGSSVSSLGRQGLEALR